MSIALHTRPLVVHGDLPRLCSFLSEIGDGVVCPGAIRRRLADPSLDPPQDTLLCENADGEWVGAAIVEFSSHEFDLVLNPRAPERDQAGLELMAFVGERVARQARTSHEAVVLFTNAREGDRERIDLLQRHGLVKGQGSGLYLRHRLDSLLPPPNLARGLTVRAFAGPQEAEAYVEAHRQVFWTQNLTREWRIRLAQMPGYRADHDLVAVAPDGCIAGFCLSWLDPQPDTAGGRREGYLQELGVRPGFRKLGLGRALFLECLTRLKADSAASVVGHVSADNQPALDLYQNLGARPVFAISSYYSFTPS